MILTYYSTSTDCLYQCGRWLGGKYSCFCSAAKVKISFTFQYNCHVDVITRLKPDLGSCSDRAQSTEERRTLVKSGAPLLGKYLEVLRGGLESE
jgi:hypothetical protein